MLELRLPVAFLLGLAAASAVAQSLPSKPLTLYCPCPPNSANAIYAQEFSKIAAPYLGQPLSVQMPPTNSLGIAEYVASARPDGHSLFLMHIYVLRLPHLSRQRLSWHPINDFSYVIGLSGFTFGLVVKADSEFKTAGDLIAFAKANPGKLRYAAFPPGTTQHLAMEDLGQKAGVAFQNVQASFAESVAALTNGRIHVISDSTAWGPYVDAGTFRLLLTFGQRQTKWKAPTASELGYDVLAYSPFGIVAPKGLDPARSKVLHDAFNRALDDPAYNKLLSRLDMVDWYKSSEDFADWAVDQFKFQEGLIQRTVGLNRF